MLLILLQNSTHLSLRNFSGKYFSPKLDIKYFIQKIIIGNFSIQKSKIKLLKKLTNLFQNSQKNFNT